MELEGPKKYQCHCKFKHQSSENKKYVVSLRLKCCKFYLWGEVVKRERGKRECGKKERRNGVELMYDW